jgi:hypothetical protein
MVGEYCEYLRCVMDQKEKFNGGEMLLLISYSPPELLVIYLHYQPTTFLRDKSKLRSYPLTPNPILPSPSPISVGVSH